MANKRLGERIKHAENEEQIQALLREGEGFQDASDGTRRRWQKLARNRRTQLKRKEQK